MNKLILILLATHIFVACSPEPKEQPLVVEQFPLFEFSYTPSEIHANQEVLFSARFLTGSSLITSWLWEFGDVEQTTSNQKNTTFTYQEPGTYTVSLTATDEDDVSETISEQITVLDALPEPYQAQIAWSFSNETALTNFNDGASSPVIDNAGIIYYLESYVSGNSKMIAVTDNGTSASKIWSQSYGGNLRNAPSIDTEGNIYIGAWTTNALTKVNPTNGQVIWSGNTGSGISNSTIAIDQAGNTYFGTRSAGILSWDSNGTKRWEYKSSISGARYYASPVISADQTTVYALMTSGEIYALNTSDGTLKWDAPLTFTGDATGSALSLNSDGTLYLTTSTEVIAVTDNNTSGTIKWRYETENANSSGVVVGLENQLYVGSNNGLIALNAENGISQWIYSDISVNESVPAVDSNGNVYIGDTNGNLNVLNPEGNLLKVINLCSGIVHSPTIADDGSVFVEGFDTTSIKLFKIEVPNSTGPANTVWPMKGSNKKNTGLNN